MIDDEPTVRMLVGEVLADLGFAAIKAEDGAAPRPGVQEAWIQTSLPHRPMRLNFEAMCSSALSLRQSSAWSADRAQAGSANMRWCRPLISADASPSRYFRWR